MANFVRIRFICKFRFPVKAMWTEMLQSGSVVGEEVVANLKQGILF